MRMNHTPEKKRKVKPCWAASLHGSLTPNAQLRQNYTQTSSREIGREQCQNSTACRDVPCKFSSGLRRHFNLIYSRITRYLRLPGESARTIFFEPVTSCFLGLALLLAAPALRGAIGWAFICPMRKRISIPSGNFVFMQIWYKQGRTKGLVQDRGRAASNH